MSELHEALQEALRGLEIGDEDILTGWCVAYETRGTDNRIVAGVLTGPDSQTPWGAIGLLEWARQCINDGIGPNDDD